MNGYLEPTPIQRESIPPLVAGRDLIGVAATGTGKTAAFALPLVQRVAVENRRKTAVLILVPTRELALQVAAAVAKYGEPLGVRAVPVYGGAGFSDQIRALRDGVEVVVATPGRALDHMRRGTMPMETITAVVLDEADEMLDMGFAEEIEALLSAIPAGRQTALFSATMPPRIAGIANRHLRDPIRVSVAKAVAEPGEAPKVRQTAYMVEWRHKTAALGRILDYETPSSAIVFCRTRHEADNVAESLTGRGNRPESLHGGMSQDQRDRVMRKFRDGAVNLLIATDVAARG
ncbi:MAG: DEAD/DEAH box helicase, partial [Planctomycetia bacterium]